MTGIKIMSYDQKACPICGAEAVTYTRDASSDFVGAQYDCGCQWDVPHYSTVYNYHENVRRQFEAFRRGVPEDYRRYMTAPIRTSAGNLDAIEALREFPERRMFFIHGPAGVGKTHLAIRTMMRLVDLNKSARFVSEIDLVSEYRAKALTGEAAPLPQGLVLDDIAKEGKPGEFYAKTFYRILEGCVAGGRALIMTSNHSPEVVAERVALDESNREAILSRLTAGVVVQVQGVDQRVGSL